MTIPLIPVFLPTIGPASAGTGQGALTGGSPEASARREAFRTALGQALGTGRSAAMASVARRTTVMASSGSAETDASITSGVESAVAGVGNSADGEAPAAALTAQRTTDSDAEPVGDGVSEGVDSLLVSFDTDNARQSPMDAGMPNAAQRSGEQSSQAAVLLFPTTGAIELSAADANFIAQSTARRATELQTLGLPSSAATAAGLLPVGIPSRDPAILHPEFRTRLDRVVDQMEALGYTVTVVETGRSQARQDYLWAQGRERPGSVVTWTRASLHTQGLATDIQLNGTYSDPAAYSVLAQVARTEGLRTLGASDPGHIELPRQVAAAYAPVRSVDADTLMPAPAAPLVATLNSEDVTNGTTAFTPTRTLTASQVDIAARVNAIRTALGDSSAAEGDADRRFPTSPRQAGAMLRSASSGLRGESATNWRTISTPVGLTPTSEPHVAVTAPVATVATVAATAQIARVAQPATAAFTRGPSARRSGEPAARDAGAIRFAAQQINLPLEEVGSLVSAVTGSRLADPLVPPFSSAMQAIGDDADVVEVVPFRPLRIARPETLTGSEGAQLSTGRSGSAASDNGAASLGVSRSTDGETLRTSEHSQEAAMSVLDPSPTMAEPEHIVARSTEPFAEVHRGALSNAQSVGVDPSERIARVLRLQDSAREQSLSSVVLRVDAPGGGEDRIRVDLRGPRVDAVLNMSDAASADHLRQHASELTAALAQSGLESDRIAIRTAQRVTDATQSMGAALAGERDGIRSATGGSASQNNGSSTSQRDARQSQRHDDQARDTDRQQSRQRRQSKGE